MTSACKYSRVSGDISGNNVGGLVSPDSEISYATLKNSTLRTCSSCHSGQKQPDIFDFPSTRSGLNKIITKITDGSMPPQDQGYTALSTCEIKLFEKWVNLGAPESSPEKVSTIPECQSLAPPSPLIPIELMPLTYETLVTRFLQKKCLMCHNPKGDDFDATEYLFYPYEEIDNNIKWWTGPGETARIVRKINGQSENPMPPMDSNIEPATKEEVDFIIRWINAGRPQ